TSQIEVSGSTEITGNVIASLAFMAGSIPGGREGILHLPSGFDLHQAAECPLASRLLVALCKVNGSLPARTLPLGAPSSRLRERSSPTVRVRSRSREDCES